MRRMSIKSFLKYETTEVTKFPIMLQVFKFEPAPQSSSQKQPHVKSIKINRQLLRATNHWQFAMIDRECNMYMIIFILFKTVIQLNLFFQNSSATSKENLKIISKLPYVTVQHSIHHKIIII